MNEEERFLSGSNECLSWTDRGVTSAMCQLGMSSRKKIGRTREYFEFVQESAEQSPSRMSGTVEIMTTYKHQCRLSASFIVMYAFL